LRKAIKIKALTILFAWLVVFAHSIIPHHHIGDQSGGCHGLVHDISSERSLNDFSLKGHTSEHEKVCHFEGNLYQFVNLDNLFYSYDNKSMVDPVILSGYLFNSNKVQYLSKPETGTLSERAPPVL
jgi:hypothetical protein